MIHGCAVGAVHRPAAFMKDMGLPVTEQAYVFAIVFFKTEPPGQVRQLSIFFDDDSRRRQLSIVSGWLTARNRFWGSGRSPRASCGCWSRRRSF